MGEGGILVDKGNQEERGSEFPNTKPVDMCAYTIFSLMGKGGRVVE